MKSFLVILLSVAAASAVPFLRNPEARIAGGSEAEPNQFPFQVAIITLYPNDDKQFCGGSLISERFVLTAAHCLDGGKSFTVVLGAHEVENLEEPGQVRIEATSKIIHPGWNPLFLSDDIALIELPEAVKLNDKIQLVQLPKRSEMSTNFIKSEGTISGWGHLGDSNDEISQVLQFTTNTIVDNEECSKTLLGLVRPTNICLSGKNGRSVCSGDSGGPLTVVDENNQVTLIGLTSIGSAQGCERGFPTAFTRITSYLDWIEINTDVEIE